MSTIVEALRKAQNAAEGRYEEKIAPPVEKRAAAGKLVNVRKGAMVLAAFFLFSAGVLGYFLLQRSPSPEPEKFAAEFSVLSLPAQEAEREPVLKKPVRPAPAAFYSSLDLSGIMYLKGKPRAIINNRVLAEGEAIEGFRILKIELDSVDIESPEGVATIRLAR